MIDFIRSNNDIGFDGVRFLTVSDKDTQLKQRLELRIQRYKGEFAFNIDKGIDYLTIINGKNPDLEIIDAALKAECFKEDSITELIKWESSVSSDRKLTVNAEFKIDTGNIIQFSTDI